MKELFQKLLELFQDTNAVKVAVTLDMVITLAEFVETAWKDFQDDQPTEEEQLILYEKFDQFVIEQKQRMKDNIAAAKAEQEGDPPT